MTDKTSGIRKFYGMSIRNQMYLVSALAVVGIIVVLVIVQLWIANNRTAEVLIDQGKQIAVSMAKGSTLALLYQSSDNAAEAAKNILAYPSVDMVAILDHDRHVFYQTGNVAGYESPAPETLQNLQQSMLLHENHSGWLFAAPVRIYDERTEASELYKVDAPVNEIVGYALVGINKSTLHILQREMLLSSVFLAVLILFLVVIAIKPVINHITKPLHTLPAVMRRVTTEKRLFRIEVGNYLPKEIRHIATHFNFMVDAIEERDSQLRGHAARLETEVAVRTRELVLARDQAIAASRHKSEFLSNTSHELRTPLQSIIGYCDLLIEQLADEDLPQYITDMEVILGNAQRLLKNINDILCLSRLEAGRMELQLTECNVNDVIYSVMNTLRPLLAATKNEFSISKKGLDNFIYIDTEKLQQIILNICINANKFTQNGHIHLTVEQTPSDLTISVADNGIGIDKAQREHIFEPFYQVDAGITRKYGGTGLGLAITRQICDLMGGTINIESELGKGSVFTIHIPLPVLPKYLNE